MDWLREKTMNWLKSAEPQKAIEEKPKLLTGWRLPFDDGISAIAAILRDVQNGFYIDVGAGDPVVGSVTQLFYEQGWHGINIEPIRLHHESLQKKRIRDIRGL